MLPFSDAADLLGGVVAAEKFYAGHGVATRFQITPGACPAGLDALLASRGYHRGGQMSLQVAEIAQLTDHAGVSRVRLTDHPTAAWFAVWQTVHGSDGCEWDLLARISQPAAYACAMINDEVVAVGRAVADTGWAGVFGMATLPAARGKGAARSVLAALAGWAGAHGADRMYLQLERDNQPALRLYERAGFTEIRGYHYRTAE